MNIDKLHSDWMERYKDRSRAILGPDTAKAYVVTYCDSQIVDPVTGRDCEYSYVGEMMLPTMSARVCLAAAKFSQSSLINPPAISGLEIGEFTEFTFNLRSLLLASFPRDVQKDKFKGDNVGMYVLVEPTNLGDVKLFVALGGFGVLLMEKCRALLDDSATDEEILVLCEDKYLTYA